MVEQAFGLVGNIQFVNVLVYVSRGHDVQNQQETEEGYGGEEKELVKKRDFNSYQKSPKWTDSPTVCKRQSQATLSLFILSFQLIITAS